MGFKKVWKRLNYPTIGGLIGIIVGITFIYLTNNKTIYNFYWSTVVNGWFNCWGVGDSWLGYAIILLFGLPIYLGMVGFIIGLIVNFYLKTKK